MSYNLCISGNDVVPSLYLAANDTLRVAAMVSDVLSSVPFLLYPTEHEYTE